MRLFHLHHPDQADDLPAHFAAWALAWDMTEQEVRAEKEREAAERASQQ